MIQIIALVLFNTSPAPLGDASQMPGAVMVTMIVAITQMNRVVHQCSVHSVNSDVWMEIASLEAGAVMGSVTVKMTLMKQDAVSSSSYQLSVLLFTLSLYFYSCS